MEGGKKSQSGSSFTSDLFGSKNSASSGSSCGIFGSTFTPPEKVLGRESLHSFESQKKDDAKNKNWSSKTGVPDAPSNEDLSQSIRRSKDVNINSYFQEEKVRPFHYSSSIYYGGQDVYPSPESTTNYNKYEAEDDSGMASRGNWWLGSLYY